MIAITFNSLPAFLVTARPDWQSPVLGEFSKRTSNSAGLSNRENREEMAEKLITSIEFTALLDSSASVAARGVLTSWDNRPVLCPFWPAETLATDYASSSVQGTLRLWFEPDWNNYAINTGTAPSGFTPTAACRTAPLIVGRFDGFPQGQVLSGNDDERWGIRVIETGDAAYALRAKAVTLTNGASVHSVTFPLMNVPFTWGNNQTTADVRIQSERIGFGRQPGDIFYPQAARTKNSLNFEALNTAEVAYLLRLFEDRGGTVKPFWCLPPHSLSTADRVFGRFFGNKLSFEWVKPTLGEEVARTTFDFLSLPPEYALPSGETYAETIGPMSARWFGYKVECGAQTWYFTSYESSITGPGSNVFSPQQMSHGRIKSELNLAVNDCTLELHAWSGCPFELLIPRNIADPMKVTIYEGFVADATSAAPIYTGYASAPEVNGTKMRVKLRGPGSVLSTNGPRLVLQETCWAILGDSRCTKDRSTFETDASLLNITDGVGEVDVAGAGFSAADFRYGYAERTIAGHTQRINIVDSYTLPSGNLGIVFGSAVVPAVTATETGWKFFKGCDGFFDTCKNKFNNVVNFRGAPRLPRTNPSIVPIQQGNTGKKSG